MQSNACCCLPCSALSHLEAAAPGAESSSQCRVNGNLNLSRAIGDLRYKGNELLAAADQIISAQPDVTQITLSSSDWFLVLACDGVWDVMSNQVSLK